MIKRAIIVAVALIVLNAGLAFATLITISLPDLAGPVPSDPDWISTIINAGTSFQDIQDVRIVCNGFMTPGFRTIRRTGGVEITSDFYGRMQVTIVGDPRSKSAYIYSDEFGIERNFEYYLGSNNWDFLLDGQAEIKARMFGSDDPGTLLKESTATITEAYLIIEGTPIPEPVSVLLFGLGGLILRKVV